MASYSTPDLVPAFHLQSLEPLAVASCPPSPITTRRRAPLLSMPLPQLPPFRTLVKKLNPKPKARTLAVRPRGTFPPSSRVRTRRATLTGTLTITNPAFFVPARVAVDERVIGDADSEVESMYDIDLARVPAPSESPFADASPFVDAQAISDDGFRAPPPTPLDPFHPARSESFGDPFRSPPHTPLLASEFLTQNPLSVAAHRARCAAQARKIEQVFGPEAREAAREHVTRSVGEW